MRMRRPTLLLGVALVTILIATSASNTLQSSMTQPDPQPAINSTPGAVTLTIYQNQSLALIQDDRTLDLTQGVSVYPIQGISDQLLPQSVQIDSPDHPGALLAAEQHFLSAPADAMALLRSHIGEPIEVYAGGDPATYHGQLVSLDGGVLIRDDQGQMHLIQDATRFSFPAGGMDGPTLTWRLQSDLQGPTLVRVQYLTNGLNWSADYSALLDAAGASLTLKSWVSISNQTGLNFQLPKINLIAGQINRVSSPSQDYGYAAPAASNLSKQVEIGQQPVFEYHEYTLPSPATLANGTTGQVAFLQMDSVPVKKSYIFEAQRYDGVQAWIAFVNPEQGGSPLPGGAVRIYQDSASGQRFIGEDAMNHTPLGEKVSLMTGLAFDLVAKRTLLSQTSPDDNKYQQTIQIELTNRKSEAVTIQAREQMSGDWKIISSNQDATKLDANTAEFDVTLNPGETKSIQYTVEYHY